MSTLQDFTHQDMYVHVYVSVHLTPVSLRRSSEGAMWRYIWQEK